MVQYYLIVWKYSKEESRENFQWEYSFGGIATHAYLNVIKYWGNEATSQSTINRISLRQIPQDKSSRWETPMVTFSSS